MEEYEYTIRTQSSFKAPIKVLSDSADKAAAKAVNASVSAIKFTFQAALTESEPGIAVFHVTHKPEISYVITWKAI